MIIKKIVSNLAVTYIFFPIIYIFEYWDNIYYHNYVDNYGNRYPDLISFLNRIYNGFFHFSSILLFTLIFLQFIKNNYLYDKPLFFIKSAIVYYLINLFIIIFTGYAYLLIMIFPEPYGVPFIFVLLLFSIIIQGILYLLIDKYIITTQE